MATRDHIRFLMGREPRSIRKFDANRTVMQYLRDEEFRRGTKEGCAEGDCGACTVVIGRLQHGSMRYQAVNSCIQFLGTLDGCQLLTIEDVRCDDGSLHPIQQAMVDLHGSQCGFCTPGFIMSIYALWLNGADPDGQGIEDALAGNLCRCTGYGPILAAAQTVKSISRHVPDPSIIDTLSDLQDDETIVSGTERSRYFAPKTLDDLTALRAAHTKATILAGSTDVGLWVTKQNRKLDPILYLGRVEALHSIDDQDDIVIGAAVPYQDAVPVITKHYPQMSEVFRRLGSTQIREAGTIGGNIANGSPIGDSPPLLMAAGCRIELASSSGVRTVLLEDFFIDYGVQDIKPDEVLTRIIIAPPSKKSLFRSWKISKRFDQDISAICAAFNLIIDQDVVSEARIAFGGMAATPKRAHRTEDFLKGKLWSEDHVRNAMDVLAQDFSPISDMRASAEYRLKVAQNLLLKCFIEGNTELNLAGPKRFAHA